MADPGVPQGRPSSGRPSSPTGGTRPHADDASTGELVTRVSEQLSDLVRSEMKLARAEIQESAKRGGLGAGLFGTGGVVALYGLGVLVAAAILGLAVVLAAWLAAIIVAAVLFLVAGVAALIGKKQVAQVAPPVQHSVESVQADVAAVKGDSARRESSATDGDRA